MRLDFELRATLGPQSHDRHLDSFAVRGDRAVAAAFINGSAVLLNGRCERAQHRQRVLIEMAVTLATKRIEHAIEVVKLTKQHAVIPDASLRCAFLRTLRVTPSAYRSRFHVT